MSDVRVTGNLSGVAGVPASASEATRKVHAAVGAPPPPPPLKGAGTEGGVPPAKWTGRLTQQDLQDAEKAMAEIMSRGNAINSAITDAILMILQTLLKLRESENAADQIATNTQVSELKDAADKIKDEAGWQIASAVISGTIKAGVAVGSMAAGIKASKRASAGGGSVDQQLAIYNARMNQVNAVSGIGGAVADTSGGTLGGISKEEEAESKTKEAQAQQAGATEQKVAKEEETMRQFIQQVLQMISQIVDSEHQSKSHINA